MGKLNRQRPSPKRVLAVLPLRAELAADRDRIVPQRQEVPRQLQQQSTVSVVPRARQAAPDPAAERRIFNSQQVSQALERPLSPEPSPVQSSNDSSPLTAALAGLRHGFDRLWPAAHRPDWTARQLRQAVFAWLLPVLLTLTILFGVHARVKADAPPTETQLAQYLQTNQLTVGITPTNDYDQIYYTYNKQNITFTSDNYNHLEPTASGPYVAWQGVINGAGQVFLYNVLTNALTQLTSAGTNEAPSVYQGSVVWQGWDGQNWQILYYNGTQITQITNSADSSFRPSLNDKDIIYAEQVSPDDWKAQEYDITSGQTTTISEGDTASTAFPQFTSTGSVSTAYPTQ